MKQVFEDKDKGIYISAESLNLGKNVTIGSNVNINVRGTFSVGDHSVIGNNFTATGENITIGEYFFNVPTDSRGMTIGGGSSGFPFANLEIGKRVVCHTGHINLACPVTIGNDVGLSHDVDILTHGFWGSTLQGFPRSFEGVNIGNNVILGWKVVVLAGVSITNDVVVGAHSTVVKNLERERSVYGGTPAKWIQHIQEPGQDQQEKLLTEICQEFKNLVNCYYSAPDPEIKINFPIVNINNLTINTQTLEWTGEHDPVSDAFRDFLRRYGIRIFAPHGFGFNLKRK